MLSATLPTPLQTLLFRACLHSGEAGVRAWEARSERVGDPLRTLRDAGRETSRLLPLLLSALRNGIEASAPLLTYLRAAYLSERLRSQTYRRICGSALAAIAEVGVPTIVLRGAALAETAYSDPALRHCHDIKLFVPMEDVARAARALAARGFGPSRRTRGAGIDSTLLHRSGLPLRLHGRLFRLPQYDVPFEDVWTRSRTESIAEVPVRVPAPADHLLHIFGHASYSSSRSSLRWVCDAWSLVADARALEPELLLVGAVEYRLALPATVGLGYLARELEAPVRPELLRDLHAAALHSGAEAIDAALLGLGIGRRRTVARALRLATGWRAWQRVAW
jgi:hypothetical protein